MTPLDPSRWPLVSPLFDRALDMSAGERTAWLEELRAQDPTLAADVERLLADHGASHREGFLERSPARPGPTSPAGQAIGAYTLVAPLGQGGMGSVWLARRSDGRFEGEAAVKLLNASLIGRAGEERFRREGSILARLTHPHIARLTDAGVSPGGQPYLVLEYVEGEPIDRYCDRERLPVGARLRLFLDVAAAVAHAHAHLIVHRDIKPSNVLVGRDGRVKLLDFGIAKLLEDEGGSADATALTREGGRALTPQYAAPEQVTGGAITTSTDVHALGTLLYVLLSGAHPAGAAVSSAVLLFHAIAETDPAKLPGAVTEAGAAARATTSEALRRELRGDLETIVAKALKKNPAERYPSVPALSDDIRRYLAHEPIRARPDTPVYRTAKFVRRNRTAVALGALALTALVAGLAGTMVEERRAKVQAAHAEVERSRADREAKVAGEQRDLALRQLSIAEDIIDLNTIVLSDAATTGKPVAASALLKSAEEIAERQHGSGENHVEAVMSIGRQYLAQNENDDAQRLLAHAYDVASTLPDRTIRAKAACELASVIVYDGQAERAEELLRDAQADLPDVPQYAVYRARCLLRGSDVARARGDAVAAVERVEAARNLLRRSPASFTALEIGVSLSLAESYRMAGRMREARQASEQAASRLESLGRGDTTTAGTLYNNWGLVLLALGRPLEAEKLLRRSVRIDSEGGTEGAVRPMILNNLARTLRELHRLDEAAACAERAYARARASGARNVVGEALLARAGIYRERGELARASAAASELEAMLPGILPEGHIAFASLAMEQAMLASSRGDRDRGMASADRAVAICEASKRRTEYLPRLLLYRSGLELAALRPDDARADAERALVLSRETAEPGAQSALVGRAELAVACTLLAQGRADEARASLAAAVRELRPTLGDAHPDTRKAVALLSPAARP